MCQVTRHHEQESAAVLEPWFLHVGTILKISAPLKKAHRGLGRGLVIGLHIAMSSAGPILCSAFDPSNTYLACGVVLLDSHLVVVKSVLPSQGALNTLFALDKSLRLGNIAWVPHSNKFILALCMSKGQILLYSPYTNASVGELETPSKLPVADFHFSTLTQTAWLSDNGGNICEWNMSTLELMQTFKMGDLVENVEPCTRISSISYNGTAHLLIGSHSVHLVEIALKTVVRVFPGHIEPLNALLPLAQYGYEDYFITSASGDRFVNLYSLEKPTTKAVFVALLPVTHVALGAVSQNSVLIVLTDTGAAEIFNNPLKESSTISEPSTPVLKKKRRLQASAVQSRTSDAAISLERPSEEIKSPHDAFLPILSVTADHDHVLYSWLENASVPFFDKVQWVTGEGKVALNSKKAITKSRLHLAKTSHTNQGHDIAASALYSENKTIVTDGTNLNDLEQDDELELESLAEKLEKLEPELKAASHKLNNKKKNELHKLGTLTIVLSQSLKNNDHTLLETVLQNRDPRVIQHTISHLNPSLAVVLLDRLSERFERQVNRFDELNFWLRWTIIIHGAVLASMPNLSIKLSNLHSALSKRAGSLPRLLEIQGRLKMLSEQSDLKRELMAEPAPDAPDALGPESEYIEEIDDARFLGELDDEEEDEDESMLLAMDGVDDYIESDDQQGDDQQGDPLDTNLSDMEAGE